MDENNEKKAILKAMTDMEFYPAVIEEQVNLENKPKLPITRLTSLGTAFEPLASAFQTVVNGGKATSGLYRVTFPKGGHLAQFKDGSGYLGTVLDANNQIATQATLNPLVLNPTYLMMAIALANIDKKLDAIQEIQREIIEFLEQKEKSKLRGNLNILTDVLNNYKYNWNNEKYKTNKHILVQEINRDAEQSIIFYRAKIDKEVSKNSLFHSDKEVKNKLKTMQTEFKEYDLSLYLYSFSSFLEIMLLENFDSAYLDSVVNKILGYCHYYQELYTKCYDQIEKYSKSSIQSHMLSGLASINKAAGDAVAKIPVVSKSQIDETLIETGSRIGKFGSKLTEQNLEQFVSNQNNNVHPFIENINAINMLYNQPLELLFDGENIYLEST